MEFTKALRRYLSQRKGQIVDCAALHEGVFRVVPYKTLTKVISRFVKDGTLLMVSKGVYLVASDQTVDIDKAIRDYYHRGITKKGNARHRWAATMAVRAMTIIGSANPIIGFRNRLKNENHLSCEAATVAAASKLLRVLLMMLKSGQEFKQN